MGTHKERPVLFSAPMVRAILEDRKTQTRRVMKVQPHVDTKTKSLMFHIGGSRYRSGVLGHAALCPYGKPGDHLWVREAYLFHNFRYMNAPMPKTPPEGWQESFYYRADGECCDQIPQCACIEYEGKTPWRPSIHMPRWASRITLEIADVRVQRLQDISGEDCVSEGIIKLRASGRYVASKGAQYFGGAVSSPRPLFADLWEAINGAGSWDANPWVWAITFKKVEAE